MTLRVATRATCIYDSVSGLVLQTPVFEDGVEAEAFMRWTEAKGIKDLRSVPELEMLELSQQWMSLVAEHDESVCPFDVDRDSYGIGYTGDSDKHVGPMEYNVMATPDRCQCECHNKPGGVFATGRS